MKCCVCHRKLGKKAIKLYDTPDSEVWVCGVKCLRVYNQEDEEDGITRLYGESASLD